MRFCCLQGILLAFSVALAAPAFGDAGRDSGVIDASSGTDGPTGSAGSSNRDGRADTGAGHADARSGAGGSSGKSDSGGGSSSSDAAGRDGGAEQALVGTSALSCGPPAGKPPNPETTQPCTDICPLGWCVPSSGLPNQGAEFFDCAGTANKCVPSFLIETLGRVRFKSCHSVGGAEGRCLPACLPIVAVELLPVPQDDCLDSERCVPCYNPVTGADNGFCQYACDPGPQREPFLFAGCCGTEGVCLASDLLGPADRARLQKESCGASELCAPKDPSTTSFSCEVRGDIEGPPPGGSGGATSGTGGKTADKDAGKTGGAAAGDNSGCGCRVGKREPLGSMLPWLVAFGTVSLVRRRRMVR